MFDQPRHGLNIRAIIRNMFDEEETLLTELGRTFLSEQRDEVEARIGRWQHHLDSQYSDGTPPPRGDADKMRAYQIERILLGRLADQSQTEPFPAVHQRMLKQARQRVQRLVTQQGFTQSSPHSARYEAWLEQELLVAMWSEWHTWLQPDTVHGPALQERG